MRAKRRVAGGVLLWWGVLDKLNTLLDVTLETGNTGGEQLLLLVGDTVEDVDGLLGTIGL